MTKATRKRRIRIEAIAMLAVAGAVALSAAPPAQAQFETTRPSVQELDDGRVVAGNQVFNDWNAYFTSDSFRTNGSRCGAPNLPGEGAIAGGGGADCSSTLTNPAGIYDPSVVRYRIPVVVHILRNNNGNGELSDALVHSQIDILNEDFLALAGTPGGGGTGVEIEFFLATQDPSGNPTTGINRYTKKVWYNDGGNYYAQLSWDTNRYLNIYTNTAGGNLGYAYVPSGGGVAGSQFDRVVIHWLAFGRNALGGPPYNQGRTATHEVGHYLGLYHTFDPNGGCPSPSGCYTNGDLICDTNPELSPRFSECSGSSCGSPDPWENYMDYSDDLCMTGFSPDQALRMRCTVEHYRPLLYEIDGDPTGACCMPNDSCVIDTAANCSAAGGTYQGNSTVCSPNPCGATGACCLANGSCSTDTQSVCTSAGGTYQGDGTSCSPNPCPQPTGACCFFDESCSVETQADCGTLSGTYEGDGTSCVPNPCVTGQPELAPITAGTVHWGDIVSGFLESLYDSDDDSVMLDAEKRGNKYRTELRVTCASPSTSLSRLDVTTEVGVTATGVTTTIYLWNASTGSWNTLESYSQPTTDTVKVYANVANPSNYVDAATGEIIVRIFTQKNGGDYNTRIDQVEVIVTQ